MAGDAGITNVKRSTDPQLVAQIQALSPVHIDLPQDFGVSASSTVEYLTLVKEYAASLGFEGKTLNFYIPPQFRLGGSPQSSLAPGAVGLGTVAAVSRTKGTSDVCAAGKTNRRGLLAKLLGIGAIAAVVSAFGPFGRRLVGAQPCNPVTADCGDCQVSYCACGYRWTEFWYCPDPSSGYCDFFCSSYGPYCYYLCCGPDTC